MVRFFFGACGPFFLMALFCAGAAAQTAKISGRVINADKQPLPFAHVSLKNSGKGAQTDEGGRFEIEKTPLGEYVLQASSVGYKTHSQKLLLQADTFLSIVLTTSAQMLQEVEVNGELEEIRDRVEDTRMGAVSLSAKKIQMMPTIFGEKDIVKAMAYLPGVQNGGEGSSELYVRGGTSDQNLYLLNNAVLYNSNHLFGFMSAYNPDAVKSARLIKGAFPAYYGGRLSSVLDVSQKTADMEKTRVYATLGLLSSKLTIEQPLIQKRASLLLSARRSYIDLFTRAYNASRPEDDRVARYSFYDFNAKTDFRIDKNNHLSFFFYRDTDKLTHEEGSKKSLAAGRSFSRYEQPMGNLLAGASWVSYLRPDMSNTLEINHSSFRQDINYDSFEPEYWYKNRFVSRVNEYTLRNTFAYQVIPEKYTFTAGLSYSYRRVLPGKLTHEEPNASSVFSDLPNTLAHDAAVFVENIWSPGKRLKANIGMRYAFYSVKGKTYHSPEPRLSASWLLAKGTSFKFGYARMQQSMHLLANTGLGLPNNLWVSSTAAIKPQLADQIGLGFEKYFERKGQSYSFSAEAYYKSMRRIVTYKDGYSSDDFTGFSPFETEKNWENLMATGNGQSYGAEALFEKHTGCFTGWLSYTLSKTDNRFDGINGGKAFPSRFDRRHSLAVVGSYKLSGLWMFNFTWTYMTGQAVTVPVSVYALPDYTYTDGKFKKYGQTMYSQGGRNAYRMAPFHKLDIAFKREKERKHGYWAWEFGCYNVYNRRNPYYCFVGREGTVNPDGTFGTRYVLKAASLFPIIPSVSVSYRLK